MAGLAVGIELVQIFLPKRVFDPMDIAAGWLGILLVTWIFLPAERNRPGAAQAELDAVAVTRTN